MFHVKHHGKNTIRNTLVSRETLTVASVIGNGKYAESRGNIMLWFQKIKTQYV